MTLILKSNQAVNDPTGKFPIVTDMGEATVNVNNFKKALEAEGSPLTQAQFDALNTLDKAITNLGVWGNILEFIPSIGTNISARLVKFKSWKASKLTIKHNFDASNIDSKGFIWSTAQGGSAKSLGLGFTMQDVYNLPSGFGAITYFKYSNTANPNAQSNIFGAGDGAGDDPNAIVSYITVGNGVYQTRVLNTTQGQAGVDFRAAAHLVSIVNRWDAAKASNSRVLFDGQNKIIESTAVVQMQPGTKMPQEIYLGAKNATTGAVYNFFGQIGLSLFHDGKMDNAKILALATILQNFITATGKTL